MASLSEAQQRQLMSAMTSGGLVVSTPSIAKPPKSNPAAAVPASLATSGDQQQQQTGKSTTGGGNGNASPETNKKKPKRCMTAYSEFQLHRVVLWGIFFVLVWVGNSLAHRFDDRPNYESPCR